MDGWMGWLSPFDGLLRAPTVLISFAMNINGWSGCGDVGLAVDDTWHGTTTPPNRSSGDGLE